MIGGEKMMLSDKAYERMQNNGWYMVSMIMVYGEKREQQEARLEKVYKNIKKYKMTTSVKGFHKEVWACKYN